MNNIAGQRPLWI